MNIEPNLNHSNHKLEERVLKLISKNEKVKASNLLIKEIERRNFLSNPQILGFIIEPSGMTVAHKMAHHGYTSNDPKILSLVGEDRTDKNSLMAHNGCSVAYIMAKKGHMITDPTIWKIGANEQRSTVAHVMASKGYKFFDDEILKLSDDKGNTVAHVMATNGHVFDSDTILSIKNDFGFSVKEFQTSSLDHTLNN